MVPHLTEDCNHQHCFSESQLDLQQDRMSSTVHGHSHKGAVYGEDELKLGW